MHWAHLSALHLYCTIDATTKGWRVYLGPNQGLEKQWFGLECCSAAYDFTAQKYSIMQLVHQGVAPIPLESQQIFILQQKKLTIALPRLQICGRL